MSTIKPYRSPETTAQIEATSRISAREMPEKVSKPDRAETEQEYIAALPKDSGKRVAAILAEAGLSAEDQDAIARGLYDPERGAYVIAVGGEDLGKNPVESIARRLLELSRAEPPARRRAAEKNIAKEDKRKTVDEAISVESLRAAGDTRRRQYRGEYREETGQTFPRGK